MAQYYTLIIIFVFSFIFEFNLVYAIGEVNPDKITFQVYSGNQSTTTSKTSKLSADAVESVNIMLPIIFIIHGWQATVNSTWLQNMTNLLIKKQPSNVITVDWSAYSTTMNYPLLVTIQVGQIGNLVGDFIVNITRNNSNSLANVHLIGHSLGAHIAGFAGQRVYSRMNAKVARISGLDAAGPMFYRRPDNQKLSKDDAIRVNAIHTNGGRFGYVDSYGTSDFFPSGGQNQPGCRTAKLKVTGRPTSASHPSTLDKYKQDSGPHKQTLSQPKVTRTTSPAIHKLSFVDN